MIWMGLELLSDTELLPGRWEEETGPDLHLSSPNSRALNCLDEQTGLRLW